MNKLFITTIITCIIVLTFSTQAQTPYYPQHFVIVVDQGAVQGHPNTHKMYEKLKNYFLKQEPFTNNCEFPKFNPTTDQISIFASIIDGDNYTTIFNNCSPYLTRYQDNEITKIITDALFHERPDYQSYADKGDLESYLTTHLEPLMNKTWKNTEINTTSKIIGLNAYLYPLVINKIKSTTPAEKYYFFIISNFTQQGAERDTDDSQLKPLLGIRTDSKTNIYWDSFKKDVDQLECDFYRHPRPSFFSLPVNNVTQTQKKNNPKIDFFGLKISKLEQASALLTQQPTFQQLKLHGDEFECNPVAISFNHPENMHIIDCWEEIETDDGNTIVHPYKLDKDFRQTKQGQVITYEFEKQNFKLGQLKSGNKITCTYHFYTSITNQQGDTLLPMVFSTQRNEYILRDNDFIPEPEDQSSKTIAWLISVALIVIALLVYFWFKRGKKANAKIQFYFEPVSQERFMDVSNMKVKEYDCWYLDPQADRIATKIEVHGKVTTIQPRFAKDTYRFRVEFMVDDIDHDDNFTFRPKGKDDSGNDYELKQWYLVETDAKGNFNIPIIAYLDTEKHPELTHISNDFWQIDHILETQIHFRAYPIKKDNETLLRVKKRDSEITEKEIWPLHPQQIYKFIARPTFDLRDSWIAFDPGTTGACAAFITGGNIDNDNVHVVTEEVEHSGDYSNEAVFPSRIWITDFARAFRTMNFGQEITNVDSWEEGEDTKDRKDFLFGWRAHRMISRNSFQSIKKLLGYTTPQTIISNGKELSITGKKLAQLLVKGLYNHTRRFINNLVNSNQIQINQIDIRNHYYDQNGNFNPKKAIVAVPNNYTLPKIQEMVDTIKALNQFKEVHFIYESEGVLMEYCHKNWHELDQKQANILLVFDMGGATINVTAFKLTSVKKDNANNITDITVETIGKIGYCVGGDDIDYAIILQIYELSAIKQQFDTADKIKHDMAIHKQLLIKLARELKMDIIAKYNKKDTSILKSKESFDTHINSYAKEMGWDEDMTFNNSDYDIWLNPNKLCQSLIFKDYVYSKVEDSVKELLATLEIKYKISPVEIIYSGRSTLFPHICQSVEKALSDTKYVYNIWHGLETNGSLDADAVKTAVVTGACWYANFSQHITIKHNIITTSFGFLDHKNGQEVFVPIITPKDKFKDGKVERQRNPLSPTLLNEVIFVQMQGSDHKKILSDFRTSSENKHKMNILDKVKPGSNVNSIKIDLDERFNFDYEIDATGSVDAITPDNYPLSRLRRGADVKMEISDENNDSYMFAATSSKEEVRAEQNVIKQASPTIKKRF